MEAGAMSEERPSVDDRDPAEAVADTVKRVLTLAETWVGWEDAPIRAGDREYTPHKAIRRVADHMIDHLAQLEAYLAGVPSLPDEWHGSAVTTPADRAPFASEDLDEARSRLERLAELWKIRLLAIPESDLDRSEGEGYTPREMAFCAVESVYYAEAVGVLSISRGRPAAR